MIDRYVWKRALTFIFMSLTLAPCAQAQVQSLKEALKESAQEPSMDLTSLLKQIEVVPEKDPVTGQKIYKVNRVEKGSVFEKRGIKVGDIVAVDRNPGSPDLDLEQKRDSSQKKE